MKLIALTAALALGGVAYAQDMSTQTPPAGGTQMEQTTPAPTDSTDPSTMQQAPADQTMPQPPADQTMPQQPPMQGDTTSQQPPMQGDTMSQQPMAGGAPVGSKGGYMPSTPPLSGTPQPGAPVRVQPSMSPAQAFPPPAPKAEYPVCKRGQTDGCRNRGGK